MNQNDPANDPLLAELEVLYRKSGLEGAIVATDHGNSGALPQSLVVRFPMLGRGDRPVDVQFTFLPDPPGAPADAPRLLQTFVELSTTVPGERMSELTWLVTRLNTKLPLGAFGVFDDRGVLYYKQNCLVERRVATEATVRLIDQQTGLVALVLSQFRDLILDVMAGKVSAADGLRAHPLGAYR